MATVKGNLKVVSGEMDTLGQVTFALCGYGSQIPRENGVALINQPYTGQPQQPVPIGSQGDFTLDVPGNDSISPAGTYYMVIVKSSNGDVVQCNAYIFLESAGFTYDLNTMDPFDPTEPILPLPGYIVNNLLTVECAPDMDFPGDIYSTWEVVLDQDVTAPTVSDTVSGNLYTFIIVQDSVGGHAFTFPPTFWNVPAVDMTPNSVTVVTFVKARGNHFPIGNATWTENW